MKVPNLIPNHFKISLSHYHKLFDHDSTSISTTLTKISTSLQTGFPLMA